MCGVSEKFTLPRQAFLRPDYGLHISTSCLQDGDHGHRGQRWRTKNFLWGRRKKRLGRQEEPSGHSAATKQLFQAVMPTDGRSPKLQCGLTNFICRSRRRDLQAEIVILLNIVLVRLNYEVTTCNSQGDCESL